MTDTTELQALLDAATPGPWFVAGVRVKLSQQDTHAICQYDETTKRDLNIANVWYDPRTNAGHADAALISMTPALVAEVLRLTAFNAALVVRVEEADRLAGLLEEASDDITDYVNAHYPPHDHARYPEIAKRNYRDLELVRRATAALAAYHATKEKTC